MSERDKRPTETSNTAEPATSVRVLGRIWALVAPHRWRFVLAFSTLVVASGVSLIYPLAAKYAIDIGMSSGSAAKLDQIVFGLMAIFVLHAALVWLRHYSMSWLGDRVVADLRISVYDRLLTLPLAWFHERRTGELVGRLSSDATVIEGVVGSELSLALRNAIQLTGGLIFLLAINWQLTLIMLAIVPPISIGAVWFGSRIQRISREVHDELAAVSGQAQEVLGAMQTVQAFGREDAETRAMALASAAFFQADRVGKEALMVLRHHHDGGLHRDHGDDLDGRPRAD
ncbi:MAG: hypothetical protein IPL79_12780 [Myxococcales bacterium]|nr:hypothetical protein [Myxococcales bacterium]